MSPRQSLYEPRRPHSDAVTGTLAPPPSVPHGPRSPGQVSTHSRTPSPNTAPVEVEERDIIYHLDSGHNAVDTGGTPALRSAKALGKQKAVETEQSDCAYSVFPESTLRLKTSSLCSTCRGNLF